MAKAVFTVKEAAEQLGFHPDTIRSMFRDEPGVIALRRPEKMHKRKYTSIGFPLQCLIACSNGSVSSEFQNYILY